MDDPMRRTTTRKYVDRGDSTQLLGDTPVDRLDNFELESLDVHVEEDMPLDTKKTFPSVLVNKGSRRRTPSSRSGNKKFKNAVIAAVGASVLMLWLFYSLYLGSSEHDKRSLLKPGRVDPGSQAFSIENVFNGEFIYDRKTFTFIDPPQDTNLGSYQDEGLYFTVESKDGNPTFVAKKLSDAGFLKTLGQTTFNYKGESYNVSKMLVSYGLDTVIYATNVEPGFRHTSKAYYWLGDVSRGEIVPLIPRGISGNSMAKLSYAKFSPNYKFIYFVHENNLYVRDLYKDGSTKTITTDGSDSIFNGIPDWVYEEEVLASDSAVWWAPDESALVYLKLHDEEVQSQPLPKYVNDDVYTSSSSVRYPKVGTKLPVPKLLVYNLRTASSIELILDSGPDHILYYAKWLNKTCFMFKVSDRLSRRMDVNFFELDEGKAVHIRTIDAEEYGGWIEKATDVLIIPPNNARSRGEYGYVEPLVDSEGFIHLFYFSPLLQRTGKQLTSGPWEVLSGPVKFDYVNNLIYFYANKEHPMSRQLYVTSLDSERKEDPLLLPLSRNIYDYYEFQFSYGSKYSVVSYLGPNLPTISVVETSSLLRSTSPDAILKLSNTSDLQEAVKKHNLPVSSFKSIKTDDGVAIDFIEIKPAKMKSSHKYPLLVHVYGGPGSMTFDSKFNVLLDRAVVSGIGAIVLQIEPRGTGGKGWDFRKWAKDSIGLWEKLDILEVTKKYIQQERHIDTTRVAIWGWSYGGFTTLKTLEEDGGETFKYGVAVAPVTEWATYDAIYTERYMGLPSDNQDNYDKYARVNNVTQFSKLDRFMLAHGTADDNVHIQNTYKLLDRLNMESIRNFDSLIFPDSDHGISFHNAASAIYKRIYYWLANAFCGGFDNLSD